MGKLMTLDVLSSIKGATSSQAVEELFNTIKNASLDTVAGVSTQQHVVEVSELREDVAINSSETERNIIKGNFPKEKNGYLVVSKVIEN